MDGRAAATAEEKAPVFVDTTGWRRRLAVPVGAALGVLCVAYLAMVGVGLLGRIDNPLTPWPISHLGRHHASHAKKVRIDTARLIVKGSESVRHFARVPAPARPTALRRSHPATPVPTPRPVHHSPTPAKTRSATPKPTATKGLLG